MGHLLRTDPAQRPPEAGIQHCPGQSHPQELTIFPHVLHRPIDQLKVFFLERLGGTDVVREVRHFLGDAMPDERRKQAGLAPEISVNQTLRTTGAGSDFAGRSGFVTLAGKQLQGGHDESLFFGVTVSHSPGSGLRFDAGKIGLDNLPST